MNKDYDRIMGWIALAVSIMALSVTIFVLIQRFK